MQQEDWFGLKPTPTGEAITVVHVATSSIEAAVVRGLLGCAGIPSPALGDAYQRDLAPLYCEIRIYALESQAREARQVIAEYLAVGRGETDSFDVRED
jgi:hypothetical protein